MVDYIRLNFRGDSLIHSLKIATSVAFLFSAGSAFAAPVDLSSWLIDGNGNWTLEAGNNGVKQSLNSSPTAFHNNENSQGNALSGTIEVQTTGDDDFVGFVLGYTHGDINGANTDQDYLLIDWKQGTQAGWGAGMSISRVTGDIHASGVDTSSNAWQHEGAVDFLTRSNTGTQQYANVGWLNNTEYAFDIEFSATRVKVSVGGVLEFDILAADFGGTPFSDGSFGFYNFSQPNVRYAGITKTTLPGIPLPAGLPILLSALGAMGLVSRRRKS